MTCPECDGGGKIFPAAGPVRGCETCNGLGTVPEPVEARELEVPDDARIEHSTFGKRR